MGWTGKGGVEIDLVQLPGPQSVGDQDRVPDDAVDPPGFSYIAMSASEESIPLKDGHTSDITSVQDGLPIAFDQKHHCTGAMVRIEEGDPDGQPWGQVDLCWRV